MRRMLTSLTLLAVAASLAAGCAGDDTGGAASSGGSATTATTPATTQGGGTGGGRGDYGGGGGSAGQAATGAVKIAGFAFAPDSRSAKVGESVTWTNGDSATHTVTADDGAFDSGNLSGGKRFSFTFDTAGTFPYHCNIHRSMKGTVTVTG